MDVSNGYPAPYTHYVNGCAEHRLVLSRCAACGNWQMPAFFVCRVCGGADLIPQTASGRGKIASFTEVHRGSNAFFAARTPYVICLVDLEEGPRLMMQGRGPVRADAPVTISFTTETPDGTPAPVAVVELADAVR